MKAISFPSNGKVLWNVKMSKSNPSLTEVLTIFGESLLNRIHTCLPARIERYDYTIQKAEVKPLLKRKFSNGTISELPVIVNVPVVWPRAGGAILHFPLRKGDMVLLVFCEAALDFWLSKGGITEAGDTRRMDLTDAIAIPGLYPFSESSPVIDNQSVQLVYGDASIKIKNNGQVDINDGNLTVDTGV